MELVIIDYLRSSTNYNESMTCNVLNNSTFTCKNNNWMYYSNTDYRFINDCNRKIGIMLFLSS